MPKLLVCSLQRCEATGERKKKKTEREKQKKRKMESIMDVEFMKLAEKEAEAALRMGEVPVGCVFVRNGAVVAR